MKELKRSKELVIAQLVKIIEEYQEQYIIFSGDKKRALNKIIELYGKDYYQWLQGKDFKSDPIIKVIKKFCPVCNNELKYNQCLNPKCNNPNIINKNILYGITKHNKG